MKLAACIIVKNEEKNIASCLERISGCVDQIIVVDLGSGDRTEEIAKQFHAEIYHYNCWEPLSVAKNYAMEQAKSDWIIFLNANEYCSDFTKNNIEDVLSSHNERCDAYSVGLIAENNGSGNEVDECLCKIRILRNDRCLRFQGEDHEELVNLSGEKFRSRMLAPEELLIYHVEDKDQNKYKSNLESLLKRLNEALSDHKWYGYLAENYYCLGQYEEAIVYARKATQNTSAPASKSSRILIKSLRAVEADVEEIETVIDCAIQRFIELPDFYYEKALLKYDAGEYDCALDLLLKSLELYETYQGTEMMCFAKNLNKAESLVAGIYELKKMDASAVLFYQKVLSRNKYNSNSLTALLTLLIEEDDIEVIAFLNQIYDKNNLDDLSFLIETIANVFKGKVLYYYINARKRILQEDSVDVDQLLGLGKYKKLCEHMLDDLAERVKFQSAQYILRDQYIESEERWACLPEEYKRVIYRYYQIESIPLQNVQFTAYYNILIVLLTTTKKETIVRYLQYLFDFESIKILQVAIELKNGHYIEEALPLFLHCVADVNGDDLERLYENLGECYYRLGQYEEAEWYFNSVTCIKSKQVENMMKWIKEMKRER